MSARPQPFEYTVLRLVPRVERAEFLNIGVVVICRAHRFLEAKIALDRERIRAFSPGLSEDAWSAIVEAVELIPRICAGERDAGPIARLSQAERWHWVVAPSSTQIQAAPVHTGLCFTPGETLERIFAEQVAM
jgi:hypothetical protein